MGCAGAARQRQKEGSGRTSEKRTAGSGGPANAGALGAGGRAEALPQAQWDGGASVWLDQRNLGVSAVSATRSEEGARGMEPDLRQFQPPQAVPLWLAGGEPVVSMELELKKDRMQTLKRRKWPLPVKILRFSPALYSRNPGSFHSG